MWKTQKKLLAVARFWTFSSPSHYNLGSEPVSGRSISLCLFCLSLFLFLSLSLYVFLWNSFSLFFCLIFFLKIYFIWKSKLLRGRERERELHPLLHSCKWLEQLRLSQAKARIQKLLPSLPHECGAQGSGPSSLAFPGALTGHGSEAEQPFLTLVWNANTGGDSWTGCATEWAPNYFSNK